MIPHEKYMQRCLQLAQLGNGNVSPNPMVGSVLVYNDKIIGEGFHAKYGEAHAEVNCIKSVSEENKKYIKQSILYVSLEPCSHYGKTPPCVDLILENKIKKVVVGCKDFSNKVNGKGIEKLKNNGVEVIENILEKECIEINKIFFYFQEKKKPYILLKWAQSEDGFIARKNEQTKISNALTDRLVHRWRAEVDAIVVGYNTAFIDNPAMNVRLAKGKNPIRIVFDFTLNLPKCLHLFDTNNQTIVFNYLLNKIENNIDYIQVHKDTFLEEFQEILFEKNIQFVMVEGGSKTLQMFIDANCWNETRKIVSANILHHGMDAPKLVNTKEIEKSSLLNDVIYYYKNSTL